MLRHRPRSLDCRVRSTRVPTLPQVKCIPLLNVPWLCTIRLLVVLSGLPKGTIHEYSIFNRYSARVPPHSSYPHVQCVIWTALHQVQCTGTPSPHSSYPALLQVQCRSDGRMQEWILCAGAVPYFKWSQNCTPLYPPQCMSTCAIKEKMISKDLFKSENLLLSWWSNIHLVPRSRSSYSRSFLFNSKENAPIHYELLERQLGIINYRNRKVFKCTEKWLWVFVLFIG